MTIKYLAPVLFWSLLLTSFVSAEKLETSFESKPVDSFAHPKIVPDASPGRDGSGGANSFTGSANYGVPFNAIPPGGVGRDGNLDLKRTIGIFGPSPIAESQLSSATVLIDDKTPKLSSELWLLVTAMAALVVLFWLKRWKAIRRNKSVRRLVKELEREWAKYRSTGVRSVR